MPAPIAGDGQGAPAPQPRWARATPYGWDAALVLLPVAVLVLTGLAGLDFGPHWDEARRTEAVQQAVRAGSLLPGRYDYGSVTFVLAYLGAIPDIVRAVFASGGESAHVRDALAQFTVTPAAHLRMRAVHLCVTALSVVWVYAAVLAMRRPRSEAFVAACLLACSWEVAYHARWIAPDGVLMQFGALTLLCAVQAVRCPAHRRWLHAAAVAAGLGCGTKYPGALLLIVVWTAAVAMWTPGMGRGARLRTLVAVSATFLAAYLISTPGTLLEGGHFVRDVVREMQHYTQRGHGVYTTTPGLTHLAAMGEYLGAVAFSPTLPLAVAVAGAAVLGAWWTCRADARHGWLVILFPVLYIAYFCTQRVMIVRNVLVVLPFLAVLAARGVGEVSARPGRRRWRIVWGIAVALLLVANAGWLVYAARTIRNRDLPHSARDARAYVAGHPGTRFVVTDEAAHLMTAVGGDLPANAVVGSCEGCDAMLFLFSQVQDEGENPRWATNRRDLFLRWFGPREVNLAYYSTWPGPDRIMVMAMDVAADIDCFLLPVPEDPSR